MFVETVNTGAAAVGNLHREEGRASGRVWGSWTMTPNYSLFNVLGNCGEGACFTQDYQT